MAGLMPIHWCIFFALMEDDTTNVPLSMIEMNCAYSVFQDQTIILKLSHQKITEKHTTKDDAMQLQASSAMVPRAALIRIHHISI